jgi:hypothetical protein
VAEHHASPATIHRSTEVTADASGMLDIAAEG